MSVNNDYSDPSSGRQTPDDYAIFIRLITFIQPLPLPLDQILNMQELVRDEKK